MLNMLRTYLHALMGERGATAVEYGIMVALIAVVIIGAVTALGLGLNGVFSSTAENVGGVAP